MSEPAKFVPKKKMISDDVYPPSRRFGYCCIYAREAYVLRVTK